MAELVVQQMAVLEEEEADKDVMEVEVEADTPEVMGDSSQVVAEVIPMGFRPHQ
jgi:gluconate kinase